MSVRVLNGDCREVLKTLPDESVHCCVTSPPYFGLRDYGYSGQIGLEASPDAFVAAMVEVFREVRRALRSDGTLWLNLGDSYVGSANNGGKDSKTMNGPQAATGSSLPTKRGEGIKAKDLIGIPWRVALALQADGWWLRQDIIWAKPNPMPESVTDRCTKAHEYIFMLSKSARYYYDQEAIKVPATLSTVERLSQPTLDEQAGSDRVPGKTNGPMKAVGKLTGGSYAPPGQSPHGNARTDKQRGHGRRHAGFNDRWDAMEKAEQCSGMVNKRSVWTVATQPFKEAHFATFPPALIEPCILAGCPAGGTVLDPFGGAGTTGLVADRHGRDAILIEMNPEYAEMARNRITNDAPLFAEVA